MTSQEIEELLNKKTVSNYNKICTYLIQEKSVKYNKELLNYLIILLKTKKSYQLICKLIQTLSITNCKEMTPLLNNIINDNIEYDLITKCASKAYIKLDRSKILTLLKNKKYSVKEGVLEALGYYKIVPLVQEQKDILDISFDFGYNRKKGYTDPRYGLAAACAGWEKDVVSTFLQDCLKSNDEPLKYVSKNSLQGKYVKLR